MGNHLVHHELERQAHWRSDRPAIVFEGTEYTFAELDRRVNRTARALRDRGVRSGESVVVHGHNRADLLTLFFACSKLGAVYSTINTFQSRENVEYICDVLDPAVVCYTADEDVLTETLPDVRAATPGATYVSLDASLDDAPDFESLVAEYDGSVPDWSDAHDASDRHNVFWTSGTTGRPKAVARDHTSTLHFNDVLMDVFPFDPDNTRITTNDMMFAAPYLQYGLPTVASGTRNVVLREFTAESVYEACREYDNPVMLLAFTQGSVLLEYLDDRDLDLPLRYVHAIVPSAERARRLSVLAEELYHIYATTECGLVLAKRLTEPFSDPPSLGVPGRSADARLRGDDGDGIPDEPPAPGDQGELLVRGDVTMTGYVSEEVQRRNVREGWISTGDSMRVTEDGELVFVGRIDDRIRSGGINVYPAEVEAVLLDHPGVEEAIVVGVDDERWGQRVCALIVPVEADADRERLEGDLDHHCRERDSLAAELRPRTYAFVDSSDDVPTGAVNKVDREAVVRRFFEE